MASAAPHVKLLRQLSDARDDYRSGALDVDWDGGRATLYMVFGQPSHAEFEETGRGRVEGIPALAALLRDLPPLFSVEPWRKAMPPTETLDCTVDDLVQHFAELAAAHAPAPQSTELAPSPLFTAHDDSPDLAYDLTTFPMLPEGDLMAPDAPAGDADAEALARRLGSGLLTLTGPRLRAAATVVQGELRDGVWVDSESHARGESAVMAIMGARDGTLAAHNFEPELTDAIAMLWRLPVEQEAMNLQWLSPEALMESFTRAGDDRVVFVDAQTRGVGLFVNGRLVGAYSSMHRRPQHNPLSFQQLLQQPEGRITVLRKTSLQTGTAEPAAITDVPRPPPAEPAVQETARVEASEAPTPPPPATADRSSEIAGDLGIDFAEVRRELAQITISWLGERDGQQVLALIQRTPSTVDDFVATIDTVRALQLPGCDEAVVQALARDLHVRAAERLCAA